MHVLKMRLRCTQCVSIRVYQAVLSYTRAPTLQYPYPSRQKNRITRTLADPKRQHDESEVCYPELEGSSGCDRDVEEEP